MALRKRHHRLTTDGEFPTISNFQHAPLSDFAARDIMEQWKKNNCKRLSPAYRASDSWSSVMFFWMNI
jgi:hypothetical protein